VVQTLKRCGESSSCTEKIFGFVFRVFVSDVISGVGFWPVWLRFGPGPKPLDGNISLTFLFETRLESMF